MVEIVGPLTAFINMNKLKEDCLYEKLCKNYVIMKSR